MTRFLSILALAALFAGPAAAADAEVDKTHSGVMFKAHHFGAGYTWGRFNDFGGTVSMNGSELTGVQITVKAESIDTGNDRRDKHLRSPDFFDAQTHPTITFTSTTVTKVSDGLYSVTGDLGLHGVTRPLTVEMRHTGEGDLPVVMGGAHVTGWETTFPIRQSEHGMQYDAVGDEAFLFINLEVKS
ncbi:MAG: polyisoprenoid-binding protein YceI [Myxococcota bacterium]|jgi:polyisoprenoid-binding protein YceI